MRLILLGGVDPALVHPVQRRTRINLVSCSFPFFFSTGVPFAGVWRAFLTAMVVAVAVIAFVDLPRHYTYRPFDMFSISISSALRIVFHVLHLFCCTPAPLIVIFTHLHPSLSIFRLLFPCGRVFACRVRCWGVARSIDLLPPPILFFLYPCF